jgi:hypothetical protein
MTRLRRRLNLSLRSVRFWETCADVARTMRRSACASFSSQSRLRERERERERLWSSDSTDGFQSGESGPSRTLGVRRGAYSSGLSQPSSLRRSAATEEGGLGREALRQLRLRFAKLCWLRTRPARSAVVREGATDRTLALTAPKPGDTGQGLWPGPRALGRGSGPRGSAP